MTQELRVGTKTILIVDMEPGPRRELAERLAPLGHLILEAGDAEELRRVLRLPFDLAVTEWTLPGMEEGALVKTLAVLGRPVVLYTQESPARLPLDWRGLGARAAIHKMWREELVKVIGLQLQGDAGHAGEAAGPRQVLVIEDSPTMRQHLRRVLEQGFPGCAILEAVEGREAISQLTHAKVDLIITDLQMPGMDGRTFLRRLQANPLLKKKMILVLSSSIDPELEKEFESAGGVRFLAKPAKPDQILQACQDLVSKGSHLP